MTKESLHEIISTLDSLKVNSTISLAVEMANENPNSICNIAIAWISGQHIYSLSRRVKAPTDDFSESRSMTAEMVADCDSFAVVWDREILPLLKNHHLSAYGATTLLANIKASYEASGNPFIFTNYGVVDLLVLAVAYIRDVENDSLLAITYRLGVPVDLDNIRSRARACTCAMDHLNDIFPIENYYTPVEVLLRTTLPKAIPKKHSLSSIGPYPRRGFSIFTCIILMMIGYSLFSPHELFGDPTPLPYTITAQQAIPSYPTEHEYHLNRSAYIILNYADIRNFMEFARNQNMESIRDMIKIGKVMVVASYTTIEITGEPTSTAFLPIVIKDGHAAGCRGYAPYSMITQ